MKNGTELYTEKWSGDNSTKRLIGEYELDFTASTGTRITTASLTDGQKEALKNASYTFDLTTEGKAVILAVTSLNNTNSDAKDEATTPTVTIKFNATGDGIDSSNCSISNPYYAIRANEAAKLEESHSGDTIKVASQSKSADD